MWIDVIKTGQNTSCYFFRGKLKPFQMIAWAGCHVASLLLGLCIAIPQVKFWNWLLYQNLKTILQENLNKLKYFQHPPCLRSFFSLGYCASNLVSPASTGKTNSSEEKFKRSQAKPVAESAHKGKRGALTWTPPKKFGCAFRRSQGSFRVVRRAQKN